MVYVYAPDRKAARPISHLAGFRGVLQVDGYAGYKALAARGDVKLAFCWSHVRRHFYELAQGGSAPIASEALTRIAALYRIEDDIRGRAAEERRAVRLERSRPRLEALQPWLRQKLALRSSGDACLGNDLAYSSRASSSLLCRPKPFAGPRTGLNAAHVMHMIELAALAACRS